MAEWLADAILIVVLLIAVVTDLGRGRIYNWLTLPAILAGLVLWTVAGAVEDGWWGAAGGLLRSLTGFAVLFVPMLLAFAMGGIGGGDTKLAGAIGALALWRLAIYSMFYGFLAAAVVSIIVMVTRRVTKQTASRVWRLLWLLAMGARPSSPTDQRSPRIATALPWAIGTFWAIAEQHYLGGRTLFDRMFGG